MYPSESLALIHEVMNAPNAFSIVNEAKERLDLEKKKRLAFRDWLDESVKAEFIQGEIVIHPPTPKFHWSTVSKISNLMSFYVSKNNLGSVGINKVTISLERNDFQPDVVYFSEKIAKRFKATQEYFPVPTLIIEVLSEETALRDRTIKKEDYAFNGIPEYWIIDPEKRKVEQYLLFEPESKYLPPRIFMMGETIECKTIPGFAIPVDAIFDKNANSEFMKTLMGK